MNHNIYIYNEDEFVKEFPGLIKILSDFLNTIGIDKSKYCFNACHFLYRHLEVAYTLKENEKIYLIITFDNTSYVFKDVILSIEQ